MAKQHQEETARQLEKTTVLQSQIENVVQQSARLMRRWEELAERFAKGNRSTDRQQ